MKDGLQDSTTKTLAHIMTRLRARYYCQPGHKIRLIELSLNMFRAKPDGNQGKRTLTSKARSFCHVTILRTACGLTVCVIRMYLFGAWHSCTLRVIVSPGTRMGCERLGCPPVGMETISPQLRSKSAALFGHPAETNLGLVKPPRARIGTCSSKPKIHVPNLQGV